MVIYVRSPRDLNTTPRLLLLPAELRNKIYGYVFGGKLIRFCAYVLSFVPTALRQSKERYHVDIYPFSSDMTERRPVIERENMA